MTCDVLGQPVETLDTPALVIDLDRVEENIARSARWARERGVVLRPHTKTHKLPILAHKQLAAGAVGITVAKLGEAEVMAQAGIDDIFIANQVVGHRKLTRLRHLARRASIRVGIDHQEHVEALSRVFRNEPRPISVLIEIDTGQRRAGMAGDDDIEGLVRAAVNAPGVEVVGIFTHEGHDYEVPSMEELRSANRRAQETMLQIRRRVEDVTGRSCLVSIGSTPSWHGDGTILDGVDEVRVGTYIFNDASQARALGHYDWCAAWVMSTVISRPSRDRAVLDAGTKALSSDRRGPGILHTDGFGYVVGHPHLRISRLSDEHAVVEGAGVGSLRIGDVIRIIPNHVCPVFNLFERVYVSRGGRVEGVWRIQARGRSQ